jgi:hypothetical protein
MRAKIQANELASLFDSELKKAIGPVTYCKVIRDNWKEPNRSICHSHDHCDSNQLWLDCLSSLEGQEVRPFDCAADICDEYLDLIDQAWNLWLEATGANQGAN